VLRPGVGRAAFLLQSHQQLVSCLDSVYFKNIEVRPVNVGGYACSLVVAYRSEVIFVRALEQLMCSTSRSVSGKGEGGANGSSSGSSGSGGISSCVSASGNSVSGSSNNSSGNISEKGVSRAVIRGTDEGAGANKKKRTV
jgi:hypothetical protein